MAKFLIAESAAPSTPSTGYLSPYATTNSEFQIVDDAGVNFKPPYKHGADVASAATIDLDAATGDLVDVTGTTTITAITLANGKQCIVRFTGILVLTHGASLVLPNAAANITTAAGDVAVFRGYASSIVRCVNYQRLDGNSLQGVAAATQAEMEAGSSLTVQVTPGRQHFHPSAAKAWVQFNSAGTIGASYNITSITDNGQGDWTVNIATDFSTANYVGVVSGGVIITSNDAIIYNFNAVAAGTFSILAKTVANAAVDPGTPDQIRVAFFGDQP